MERLGIRQCALNSIMVFAGLVLYLLLLDFIVIHIDLTWLQVWEASAVSWLQNSAGIENTLNLADISIAYASPAFSMQIIALCTGISELLFFAFLAMLMRGPKMGSRLKGLAIFLPAIFIINIIRLLMLHPLAAWLGVQAMWEVHWFIWKYGMFIVLMALFAAWFMAFARKGMQIQGTQE